MKKAIILFLIICSLSACSGGPETQTPTQTEEPPAPTATPNPCPEQETQKALDDLYLIHDEFVHEHNRANDDYHLNQEVIVAIIGIQSDLEKRSMPACLDKAKSLLITSMQNSIDAFKAEMSGSLVGKQENFTELQINLQLFYDEHDRIEGCLPDCQYP